MGMESKIICPSCGDVAQAPVVTSVNAVDSPELKERILSGDLFIWTCPHCGHRQLRKFPLVYTDPSENILICLTDQPLAADDLQGYTGRLVNTVGELIEKIKIFDVGLDDVAVELCKYITAQEYGSSASNASSEGLLNMKFFRLDGSDNEMIFTYPQDGQMQMLSVGFNVYEDCRGIISRNPAIAEAASGLRKIDRNWLLDYIA